MAKESGAGAHQEHGFRLIGNLPWLDLVNTEAMSEGEPVDLLAGFGDLVAWLHDAGLMTESAARTTLERLDGKSDGAGVFRQAVSLRSQLRRMAERLTEGKSPTDDQVDAINRILAARPTHQRLVRKAKGFTVSLIPEGDSALQLLAPVAESAAWLLEQGNLELLRRCENPNCVLYFYDTTRNGGRRWCSMSGCGGRAKAAAYYERQRTGRKRH